jgi:tricorn protease
MNQSGYYRFPAIFGDTVIFTSEDDLWAIPSSGGIARRLTSSLSEAARPCLSPDGQWLAFTAREEGHYELYAMPALGGQAERLTFFGANTRPVGWSRDGSEILFATNHAQPFPHISRIYAIAPGGGPIREIPVGPANSISLGAGGGTVIGRNTADPARWKRYRGGTAGDLWVDAAGTGEFRRLITLKGNLASPMWIGERIYFISDHEGYGNIYSCTPDGTDIRRHTDHTDYFARNASTDGERVVYHAGADLYLFDPATGVVNTINVEHHSPRTQLNRKFVQAENYLQHYALHPEGHSVALVLRGKPVTMGDFSGPATQHGEQHGVRYRLAQYLNDGKKLVAISDKGGEEALVILNGEGVEEEERIEGMDIGRVVELAVAPNGDRIALSNHRNQTMIVDLITRQMRVIDTSKTLHDHSLAWSPDGRWLAFNRADNPETSYLMIAEVESGELHQVTEPLLHDVAPSFDPEGKYLYFLSYREFDPVYDNLHFDLGFPRGMKPYLITLRKDIINPFLLQPQAPKKPIEKELKEVVEEGKEQKIEVAIDFDGITRRVLPFPVKEGKYTQVMGMKGKAFFVSQPILGSLLQTSPGAPPPTGTLESYDFDSRKSETIANNMTDFDLSRNGSTMIYRAGKRLRAIPAGIKPDDTAGEAPGRESGWLDLSRPKILIQPEAEWRQMYREAWRLQRDFFWTEGMLGLDWNHVYSLYEALLGRIATRSEFSDLIWEMHGELGTSHAYEMGGDYRTAPAYSQGFLGADYRFDEAADAWVVDRIVHGDPWSDQYGSPLETPGVNIGEGDRLLAINGRKISREHSPYQQLVNTAGSELSITFATKGSGEQHTATVKALGIETPLRYREWVNENRRRVHEATNGRVGYVHVPNMGPWGYSEFHRGFLSEVGRGSLIVDVRFNGGGHVSQLILEKLARHTIGYGLGRYGLPEPYPMYSVSGPIVALTNENAGSDGDIFSHGFKLMKLGPLIGKRTWGGVVGIWPRNPLVDGSVTTQPEFSTWFVDVQWGVENYGTDPDIEVDIRPQDHVAGHDTQLERALTEVMRLLEQQPVTLPDFNHRPVLAPGPLPSRVDMVG